MDHRKMPATYYTTYSSATSAVYEYLESQGYVIHGDDWFSKVNLGGKPKPGETKSSSGIGLSKDGKELKKCLHIQVYRESRPQTEPDRFELNWYVS